MVSQHCTQVGCVKKIGPNEENLTDMKNTREEKLARQIDIMSFVGWLEP